MERSAVACMEAFIPTVRNRVAKRIVKLMKYV